MNSAKFGDVLYPLAYTTYCLGYSAEFGDVLHPLAYASLFGNITSFRYLLLILKRKL